MMVLFWLGWNVGCRMNLDGYGHQTNRELIRSVTVRSTSGSLCSSDGLLAVWELADEPNSAGKLDVQSFCHSSFSICSSPPNLAGKILNDPQTCECCTCQCGGDCWYFWSPLLPDFPRQDQRFSDICEVRSPETIELMRSTDWNSFSLPKHDDSIYGLTGNLSSGFHI